MLLDLDSLEVREDRQRQRRKFLPEHLEKLAGSIMDLGLLHPVGVRRLPNGGGWELSYGECRLLAVADLAYLGASIKHGQEEVPLGQIPCVDLGLLDRLTSKEAEYAENDIREQLDFQDGINALAEIHKLREEQAAERGEKQTLLATAQEVMPQRASESPSAAIRQISNALIIHKHLDDPKIASAKSESEAMKLITKKLEFLSLQAKGNELARTQKKSRHTLVLGDAFEEMSKIPYGTVDVLLTDPPYGVEAQDFGGQFTRVANFDDSYARWQGDMQQLAILSWCVAKPEAHAYVFCDTQRFEELAGFFRAAGWYVWQWPLIWHKVGANGALPRPDHGPRRMYEAILYALKGDRKTLRVDGDIIQAAPTRDSPHPHAKPVELYANLAGRSARPGDVILDPFCGTAPALAVAERQQLTALCFEANPAYFALAQKVMEAL